MKCRACGGSHNAMVRCEVFARQQARKPAVVHAEQFADLVVHKDCETILDQAVVVHEYQGTVGKQTGLVVHTGRLESITLGSRHGKHRNTEARKAYRRAWMKAKRAKEKT